VLVLVAEIPRSSPNFGQPVTKHRASTATHFEPIIWLGNSLDRAAADPRFPNLTLVKALRKQNRRVQRGAVSQFVLSVRFANRRSPAGIVVFDEGLGFIDHLCATCPLFTSGRGWKNLRFCPNTL
jgi:hypothetical protein